MLEKPIIDTKSYVDGQATPAVYVPQGGDSPKADPAPKQTAPKAAPATPQPAPAGQAAPIVSTIPDEFKGSTYRELEDYLKRKIAEHKPLSEEDLKKIRRRQKAEAIVSGISDAVQSVSNLIFTTQYAPNMYNGADSMSAKAKARFDKEKADREAKDDKFFNYAMMLGKARGEDLDRALEIWKTEQGLARQDRAHDDSRKDRASDETWRQNRAEVEDGHWQSEFDRQGEWHKEEIDFRERQFKESIREFNVSTTLEEKKISISAQQLDLQKKDGQVTFILGQGNGTITLSSDKLNNQTVAYLFSTLPASTQKKCKKPMVDKYGLPVKVNGIEQYEQPSTEAMLTAVGAYVQDSPQTQAAIRELATGKSGNKMPGVK